jgi:prepilin-type processing-associated H-X9-DG protein
MRCPTNDAAGSETIKKLFEFSVPPISGSRPGEKHCVNYLGSAPQVLPDGTTLPNACAALAAIPPGEGRKDIIEKRILKRHYNTNYTPTWFLVRSGVSLGSTGRVQKTDTNPHCTTSLGDTSLRFRHLTRGPLKRARADAAVMASNFIPLLGDGGLGANWKQTPYEAGDLSSGSLLVRSLTGGPVFKDTLTAPLGMDVSWSDWNRRVLQDYRDLAPIHRGSCNILFADGSVRSFQDSNSDGLLNNGFTTPPPTSGFKDGTVELPPEDVASLYDLTAELLP